MNTLEIIWHRIGYLFPYRRCTMVTLLSREEVLARLQQVVEPARPYRFMRSGTLPFEGHIEGHSFALTPLVWYRTSFRPVIEGSVAEESDGCQVTILMSPHLLVGIILAFCVIGACINTMQWWFANGGNVFQSTGGSFSIPFSVVVVAFLYGFLMVEFTTMMAKAKTDLVRLWEVYEVG
jgi:hypothetical protein